MQAEVDSGRGAARTRLLGPLLAGAAVALALGVYGNVHDPSGERIFHLFFTGTINLKVWFATGAAVLALFQVGSSLWLYRRLPRAGAAPAWLGPVHRLSGAAAFALTLPVAYHCLWALGFQDTDSRRLVHSAAGVFFYGALTAKIIVVHSRSLPGWALPIAGGLLFSVLVTVWYTSAFWYFRTIDFPAF
ncbi:MAG: DUF6529 family protein [Chloroflexi bacterium]|nr:DUF6529 family protein [Chloroflexota bacterium]